MNWTMILMNCQTPDHNTTLSLLLTNNSDMKFHTVLRDWRKEKNTKQSSRMHWKTCRNYRSQKWPTLSWDHRVCRPATWLLWKCTCDSSLQMVNLQLMLQSVLLKVMALHPNGVVVKFTIGLTTISRQEICQNHALGTMKRCFPCSQILQLLLSSGPTFIQTNGPWILKSSPNSHMTNLFPKSLRNTCNKSLMMKCHMVWKDTWSRSSFPECWLWYLIANCSVVAQKRGFQIYSPQERPVFWWTWQTWCGQVLPKAFLAGHERIQAMPCLLCCGWCGTRADNSTWKLCSLSIGTSCTGWNDSPGQWHHI